MTQISLGQPGGQPAPIAPSTLTGVIAVQDADEFDHIYTFSSATGWFTDQGHGSAATLISTGAIYTDSKFGETTVAGTKGSIFIGTNQALWTPATINLDGSADFVVEGIFQIQGSSAAGQAHFVMIFDELAITSSIAGGGSSIELIQHSPFLREVIAAPMSYAYLAVPTFIAMSWDSGAGALTAFYRQAGDIEYSHTFSFAPPFNFGPQRVTVRGGDKSFYPAADGFTHAFGIKFDTVSTVEHRDAIYAAMGI